MRGNIKTYVFVAILILVVVLVQRNGLSVIGVEDYSSYDDFVLGQFNNDLWNVEYDQNDVFVTVYDEGRNALKLDTGTPFTITSTKDFSGQDVKFNFVHRPGKDGSRFDVEIGGCGSSFTDPSEGLIEMISSRLEPNKFVVKLNGREVCEKDVSGPVFIKLRATGTRSSSNEFLIGAVKYKIPFNCQLSEGEFLASETFRGGDIFSTRYPVRKFCLQHPVVIFDEIQGGTAVTAEPYNRFVNGEMITVPDGQVWEVKYVFRNVDRDGNQIIPLACDFNSEFYDVNVGDCTSQSGLVQLCGEGTVFDPDRFACIATPSVPDVCENGVLDASTGKCVILVSSLEQVCIEGSLKDDGTCDAPKDIDCPFGYERRDISSNEFSCLKTVSEPVGRLLEPVNYLKDSFDFSRNEVLLLVIGLIGLIAVIVVLKGGRL